MSIARIDTETADLDLTSQVTVLTHTTTEGPSILQARVFLGTVGKPLDGTGGVFELEVSVAGQVWQMGVQDITAGTEVRGTLFTAAFLVEDGEEVILKVKSPNAGDSDVATTANLYDLNKTVTDALASIANTGAATNTPATTDSVVTTGTVASGTFASTEALDGVYWQIQDDAGTLDMYFEFNVGNNGVPISAKFTGRVTGNNDDLDVFGWDWTASAWVQIGTLPGKNTTVDDVISYDLLNTMVGSGANAGLVRVRFQNTGLTTANLYIDQIFCSFSTQFSATGYQGGAVWIDTINGTAGAVDNVNGVADLPVDNIADALTLAASLGFYRFQVAPGSSITLPSSVAGFTFMGEQWTVALNGQNCSGTSFFGATVSGTATGANKIHFENCCMDAVSLPPSQLHVCGLRDTVTVTAAGDFFLERCYSEIAGTATPSFDFGAAVGDSNVNFRNYSGGIELKNMGQAGTDTMSLEGRGQYILNANCIGGTLAVRGLFNETDNASAAVTVVQVARYSTDQIEATIRDATWTAGGVATVQDVIKAIYAMARGKLTAAGNSVTVFDDDGVTELFTLTASVTGRATA